MYGVTGKYRGWYKIEMRDPQCRALKGKAESKRSYKSMSDTWSFCVTAVWRLVGDGGEWTQGASDALLILFLQEKPCKLKYSCISLKLQHLLSDSLEIFTVSYFLKTTFWKDWVWCDWSKNRKEEEWKTPIHSLFEVIQTNHRQGWRKCIPCCCYANEQKLEQQMKSFGVKECLLWERINLFHVGFMTAHLRLALKAL